MKDIHPGLLLLALGGCLLAISALEDRQPQQMADKSAVLTCQQHVELLETGALVKINVDFKEIRENIYLTYLVGNAEQRRQRIYKCEFLAGRLISVEAE